MPSGPAGSESPGPEFPISDLPGPEILRRELPPQPELPAETIAPGLPAPVAVPAQPPVPSPLAGESPSIAAVDNEIVLVPDAEWEAGSDGESTPPQRVRPSGPGLLESIAWIVGYYAVQLTGVMIALVAVLAVHVAEQLALTDEPGFNAEMLSVDGLQQVVKAQAAVMFAVAGLATVGYSAIAVAWRLRRQGGIRGLGLQPPSPVSILLILAGTLPLSILCSEVQRVLFTYLPQAESEMTEFLTEIGKAPLGLLLLVLAVLPALGEELLFRGLIGRGLVDRLGVRWGVLVTSVLFGAMHLNPGQALAVIPLGVAMHFLYLVTRSFWAPVLLHFLNNGFAAVMLKLYDGSPEAELAAEKQAVSPPLLIASGVLVVGIAYALWRTRVRDRPKDDLKPSTAGWANGPLSA